MWKRASLAVVLSAGIVAAATSTASADDRCPLLDPSCLGETVGELEASVDGTIGSTTDVVDEVVDGAGEAADEVVGGLLGGGGPIEVPPDVDPGTDGPGGGEGPGGDGSDRSDPATNGRVRPRGPTVTEPAAVTAATGGSDGLVPVPVGPWVHGRAEATDAGVAGAALARTAAGIGALVVLLGLALGLASMQHAGDRRDPKLAPAMLASDSVPFA